LDRPHPGSRDAAKSEQTTRVIAAIASPMEMLKADMFLIP
jgi:hypothetical protein